MEASELRIHHTMHPPQKIVFIRTIIHKRAEIPEKIQEFMKNLPKGIIQGDPFVIFYYVTSVKEGNDIEIGVPIQGEFSSDLFSFRTLPKMESFSILHKGKLEDLGKLYGTIFGYAYKYGYTSQEFSREIYINIGDEKEEHEIEVQFIIHPWFALLFDNMIRVLGKEQQGKIMEGLHTIDVESPLEKKFEWLVHMLQKLNQHSNEQENYDILSSCAHFFPEELIMELKNAYSEARKHSASVVEAVDKVLFFMEKSPGWATTPIRKGNILYTTKLPRDPKAFEAAKTRIDKLKAYCFCPMIRDFHDRDIPSTFCNCGAGWVRQQWEGVFEQSLKIEIIKSLTKKDDECQFAIHLPIE